VHLSYALSRHYLPVKARDKLPASHEVYTKTKHPWLSLKNLSGITEANLMDNLVGGSKNINLGVTHSRS